MLSQNRNSQAAFSNFLILAGLELFIAGLITSIIAIQQNFRIIVILSAGVALAGVVCLFAPTLLGKNPEFAHKKIAFLDRFGNFFSPAIPIVLSGLWFIMKPGMDMFQTLGSLMVCTWLIGLELLFFFGSESDYSESKENPTSIFPAILSLLFAYGILLLPSKVPSILDGIPWNTPVEFVIATLLLPFAFLTGRAFLGKKIVTILLALLFASKFILMLLLPQAGLGVRAYFSEEAFQSGRWERSYGTFTAPGQTEVTTLPYRTFREFPVEWINHHSFESNNFWMALELNGFVTLQEDERLVFVVLGAPRPQVDLMDTSTKDSIPAVIVRSIEELDASLYDATPFVKNAELHSLLIFPEYDRRFRLEPLLLYPDGSTRSALPSIRPSSQMDNLSSAGYRYLPDLIHAVLIGILLISLMQGVFSLVRAGILSSIDLYLAATGPVLYYLIDIYDNPNINLLFLIVMGMLALIVGIDLKMHPRKNSGMRYVFSIGTPMLLMFLALNLHTLQSIEIFPTGQDSLEYQLLAHNIFVNGDIFLAQTPPWAYKVLFPYIVGSLHLLFGQSASAQLFLNAWCAILSGTLISRLLTFVRIPMWASMLTSILFPLILLLPSSYIFYFRFGLIEPLAILCLLAAYYFAFKQQIFWMFITGMAAALLRLNFIGAILASAIFIAFPGPIAGLWIPVWKQFLEGLRKHWKLFAFYLFCILAPTLLITLAYSLVIPNYTLSPNMNRQTSIGTVLESLLIVVVGGDVSFLSNKLQQGPLEISLIAVPVALGFLLAIISSVYRKGIWKAVDLRLSLALLSFLPVYAALKPIAYFPRYSWSPLPFALIIIAASVSRLLRKNEY